MNAAFFDQPEDVVIKELEAFSFQILSKYPIEVKTAVSINYEYNATLKVETTDGQLFALRINIFVREEITSWFTKTASSKIPPIKIF